MLGDLSTLGFKSYMETVSSEIFFYGIAFDRSQIRTVTALNRKTQRTSSLRYCTDGKLSWQEVATMTVLRTRT